MVFHLTLYNPKIKKKLQRTQKWNKNNSVTLWECDQKGQCCILKEFTLYNALLKNQCRKITLITLTRMKKMTFLKFSVNGKARILVSVIFAFSLITLWGGGLCLPVQISTSFVIIVSKECLKFMQMNLCPVRFAEHS